MKAARCAGRSALALLTGMMIVAVAACGPGQAGPASSGQSSGPLQATKAGGRLLLAVASVGVNPGEPADGEAFLVNSAAPGLVRVTRVTAVPVPGQRAARLTQAGVAATGEGIAGARGWPPPVPVRPAPGARLAHGRMGIVFGFTGSVPDREYALAGVRITYEYRGRLYSAVGWAVEVACVSKNWRKPGPGSVCRAATDRANKTVERMTGLSS